MRDAFQLGVGSKVEIHERVFAVRGLGLTSAVLPRPSPGFYTWNTRSKSNETKKRMLEFSRLAPSGRDLAGRKPAGAGTTSRRVYHNDFAVSFTSIV
jgi:hypothetical protein